MNDRTWEDLLCCALLAVLSLVLLWPVVAHPGWWLWSPRAEHPDLAVTHWPNAHLTRRSLWDEGRFPLWRSTLMSGTPLAANPVAGLYYPPNWLFLFLPWLPLEVGFNLSALAHLWLAGAAMFALLRQGLRAGAWGALAAGVVYEAAPKLLAHLGAGHVGWMQAWGWLPLVILGWIKLGDAGTNRRAGWWMVGAAVALACQFCADVRMAAYTLILVMTWSLVSLLRRPRAAGRYVARIAGVLALLAGLTACQWLPLAALLPETTRDGMTLRDAAVWSLPWRYLAGVFIPDHGGFHEWMVYVGVVPLVLAGIGARAVWRRPGERWLVGWLVSVGIGAAWFSLGENGGLFQLLWRLVPGLGLLRVPPRAWVLVHFAAAALAGLGVDEVWRGRQPGRWAGPLLLAVGTAAPLLAVGFWLSAGALPLNLALFGLLTPLVAALVGFGARGRAKPGPFWSGTAVLLIAIDLLVVDGTLVEVRSPAQVWADGQAAAEWLAAQPGEFRVYSPSYSLPQHVAERYGLALADGVDPLQLRVYADYLTRAAGLDPQAQGYSVTLPPFPEGAADVRLALQDVTPDPGLLGALGVRYVAAAFPLHHPSLTEAAIQDGVYIYLNGAAQPVMDVEQGITLSGGTPLFQYDPTPVYVGWAFSGLAVGSLLLWFRARWSDGVSLER
ncbi:MAG TPA: hypothetical protein ENN99_16065 [Chloroflexi bacterium]|nr:hypothetical protein [Chloroflexota bacterium]